MQSLKSLNLSTAVL